MKEDQILVRYSDVQKTYDGETLVIKDLNLDIRQGEFLTLLGPSGSGKTTTLMMLAGFEAPTHGHIFFEGHPINAIPPYRRNIGMVFQNYALFPHMTVEENLAFPLEVRRLPRAEIRAKIERALTMVRLEGFGKRRPGQLSGGQQQRVALARALVFEPKLVLMDEPLGALDKQLREQMQLEIKHIHQDLGVTVVYVTHDQSEALTMSDRIAVFNDGDIQQLATPDGLYERPQNAFVAQFIGENNRVIGRVRGTDGRLCEVETGDGSKLIASTSDHRRPGQSALVSIRPERVRFADRSEKGPNVFDAQVCETIYLGDHVRVRVAVFGQEDFVLKIPNSRTQEKLATGATLRIVCAPEDCRALDAP